MAEVPRWVRLWFGRRGVGHSPSAHWSGGRYRCLACPDDDQPRWGNPSKS